MAQENFCSENAGRAYPFLNRPTVGTNQLPDNAILDIFATVNISQISVSPSLLYLTKIDAYSDHVNFIFSIGSGAEFEISVSRNIDYGDTESSNVSNGLFYIVMAIGDLSGIANGHFSVSDGEVLPSLVEYDVGVYQITLVNRDRVFYTDGPSTVRQYRVADEDVGSNMVSGYSMYPYPTYQFETVSAGELPSVQLTVSPGCGSGWPADWEPNYPGEPIQDPPWNGPKIHEVVYRFNGKHPRDGNFKFYQSPGLTVDFDGNDLTIDFDVSQLVPSDPNWVSTQPPTGNEIVFSWHTGLPSPVPGGIYDQYMIVTPYPVPFAPDDATYEPIMLDNPIPEIATYTYRETGQLWRITAANPDSSYTASMLDETGSVASPLRQRCVYPLPSQSSLNIGDEGICLIRSPYNVSPECWYFFVGGGGQDNCCRFVSFADFIS